ncbi:internal virion protein B [Pectobacterium phage Jarilo]|uniref:Internal virion protein gp14 n=1 Tax=Pectobacterium phage Jarilo TaxID=2163634 RepID=A0A2S1GT51_9CAUD|nr:internal virion protein [Pectobacterium phage Jarilo]AWD92519.1 internal virion protein B [Pectobacterium phage Jarilo]
MVAIPIAMMAVSAISGNQQQAKAIGQANTQSRQQAIEMLKQSNIQNADAKLEQKQQLEEASSELTSQNMQKVQALGTIRAAIGESMLSGKSFDRVANIEEGKFTREANMVTDNYRRDYANLFAQQVGNTQSTAGKIKLMQQGEGKMKSGLQQVLDPLSLATSSTANAYMNGAFDSKTPAAGKSGGASISAAKGTSLPSGIQGGK